MGSPEAQKLAAEQAFRLPARTDLPPEALPEWARDVLARLVPAKVDWNLNDAQSLTFSYQLGRSNDLRSFSGTNRIADGNRTRLLSGADTNLSAFAGQEASDALTDRPGAA